VAKARSLGLWTAVLALCAANLALVWQNRELKIRRPPTSSSVRPAVGQTLRSITGVGQNDRVVRVTFPSEDRSTLLVALSGGCPFCAENQDIWRKLSTAAVAAGWRVVWVSRDPAQLAYTQRFEGDLPGIRVSEPAYGTYLQLGLTLVPHTLIVSSRGQIEQVWGGVLAPQARTIEMFLRKYDQRMAAALPSLVGNP
jgi:hypothetical protein